MLKNRRAWPLLWIAVGLIAAILSPVSADETSYGDVSSVEWIDCYDGDTCRFNIPQWPPIIGNNISVRLSSIDTPEIRGDCPREKRLARQARDALKERLSSSRTIVLENLRRGKYFRILTDIKADDLELGQWLIDQGLARPYHGGTRRSWCEAPREDTRPRILLATVKKREEIAVIRNIGHVEVDLAGWMLISERGDQRFVFPPSTRLRPGEMLEVVSGQDATPDPPFRLIWTQAFVWDNEEPDRGILLNRGGKEISRFPR